MPRKESEQQKIDDLDDMLAEFRAADLLTPRSTGNTQATTGTSQLKHKTKDKSS
jgi:hypothetical protein